MPQKNSAPPECRRRGGTIGVSTLARIAVVMAAGLGLAACVGPYADDGYGPSQYQYRPGPSYDTGYDQRRGGVYRQEPSGDQRWNHDWWRSSAYSRDRRDY